MTDGWRQEQNGLAPLAPASLSSRALSDWHQSLVGMSAHDPGIKRVVPHRWRTAGLESLFLSHRPSRSHLSELGASLQPPHSSMGNVSVEPEAQREEF